MAKKEPSEPITPRDDSDIPEKQDTKGGQEYGAAQIDKLEGLEAVRKRPGMYIGSTGERGLHHLVYEVVDNSVDEALAGEADTVDITIHPDNRVTVTDNGRGIPVDDIPKYKKSALEIILTGRKVPAEEALRIGACEHVVPDGGSREFAEAMAHEIAVIGTNTGVLPELIGDAPTVAEEFDLPKKLVYAAVVEANKIGK